MIECSTNYVIYGNYQFNAFVKSNASIQPIMADDGYTIKYQRVTFECEFVITYETVQTVIPFESVDGDLDSIKQTLTKSGLPLEISGRGFGTAVTCDMPASTLLEGPFPEILDWEPIAGNKAVRCKWKVSYNRLNCTGDHSIIATSSQNPNNGYKDRLLSLTEEQDLDISEMGAITLTVTGFVEFEGERKTDDPNKLTQMTRKRLQTLATWFETAKPLGFHRKTKLKFLKNSRSYAYTIVDTEIESETAGFPFVIKAEVTHEVSSSLVTDNFKAAGGFYKWMNTFNGVFQVRPGAWKGWAWIAFLVYLFNRRDRAEPLIGSPDDFMKDEKDAAQKDKPLNDANKKRTPKQLPLALRIKEHLHSRQVEITMKYLVMCSLRQLFDATGLFYPLDTLWSNKVTLTEVDGKLPVRASAPTTFPTDIGTTPFSPRTSDPNRGPTISRDTQWRWFRNLSQDVQNMYGYRNMLMPDHTFIYNPCPDTYSKTATDTAGMRRDVYGFWKTNTPEEPYRPKDSVPPTTPLSNSSAALGYGAQSGIAAASSGTSVNYRDNYYLAFTKPEDTWITRNDSITLIENINANMMPSIEAIGGNHLAAVTASSPSGLSNRENTGFSINDKSAGFADTKYNNHTTMAFGLPTYYVRLTGHALRVGYGIQCPTLYGVYKDPNPGAGSAPDAPSNLIAAYRIGINRWVHKQVSQTADIPVFMAMWDVTYALQGDPTRSNIVYRTNYASEYA